MDRYQKKALFHEKAAKVQMIVTLVAMFVAMLFACTIDECTEEWLNTAFVCGLLCMAVAYICLYGYYADKAEAKRWLRRRQSHMENMYWNAIHMAIMAVNDEQP